MSVPISRGVEDIGGQNALRYGWKQRRMSLDVLGRAVVNNNTHQVFER